MQRILPLLTLATLPLLTALAHAGPSVTGGGKGVVCRDANRNVLSVETLDLWEAREIYGLKPEPMTGTLRDKVLSTLKNLSGSFRSDEVTETWPDGKMEKGATVIFGQLQNHAYPFFKTTEGPGNVEIRWLRNVNLTPTNDAYDSATPTNCAIEQIIAFGDSGAMTGRMIINQDLWDLMDETNRAAMIVHESYYKELRYMSAELSSLRTRRAVGLAFSGHQFQTLSDSKLPETYYVCVRKPKVGSRVPSEESISRVFVFGQKNPKTDRYEVIFQAASLGGVSIIGTPPFTSRGEYSNHEVDRFDDLSSLVSRRMNYTINLRRSVQEEMDPTVQVVKAGPKGALKLTVTAPASVFIPNGLRQVPLTCQYHSQK